ncbi:hypothetical protein M0R45_012648 [Rubus argutus]|uniref:Phytocyanin domain-containing protein n=1 Tax=Rubus argutus TaxID=59490 RepID=A0AAW1YGC3_RUBAR
MAGFSSTTCLLLIFLLLRSSEARDILVGGKADAWAIPSSESQSLNKWAETNRFRTGDTLVWKYDSAKDSVLLVTKEDYVNCNTSSPIQQYKDGETKIVLDKSGPFYFISGTKDHCEKGQKLIVVVLSQRNRPSAVSPAPSPALAVEIDGPAVAPTPTSSASAFKAGLIVALMGVLAPLVIF